jgi:hypothetical protein
LLLFSDSLREERVTGEIRAATSAICAVFPLQENGNVASAVTEFGLAIGSALTLHR